MSILRSTGITTMLLLIVILLITISVASVITGETNSTTTEYDIDEITDEVINEITTYLKIRDQKGKYYNIDEEQKIEKIAILISPLVSQDIDLSQLTVQIENRETVRILTYELSDKLNSQSIFEHDVWDSLTGDNYGLISIIDLDESITEYNTINENSDNAYLVFRLPSDMTMSKYDKTTVTLFPSSGITRITVLEAPMPMNPVVTFE
jgi:archaellin